MVTLLGMVTAVILAQPIKVDKPKSVTELGMMTDVMVKLSLKISVPKSVTVEGMVISPPAPVYAVSTPLASTV